MLHIRQYKKISDEKLLFETYKTNSSTLIKEVKEKHTNITDYLMPSKDSKNVVQEAIEECGKKYKEKIDALKKTIDLKANTNKCGINWHDICDKFNEEIEKKFPDTSIPGTVVPFFKIEKNNIEQKITETQEKLNIIGEVVEYITKGEVKDYAFKEDETLENINKNILKEEIRKLNKEEKEIKKHGENLAKMDKYLNIAIAVMK